MFCGDARAEVVDWKGTNFPVRVHNYYNDTDGRDPNNNIYDLGVLASGVVGRLYRVCWAHNAQNTT